MSGTKTATTDKVGSAPSAGSSIVSESHGFTGIPWCSDNSSSPPGLMPRAGEMEQPMEHLNDPEVRLASD